MMENSRSHRSWEKLFSSSTINSKFTDILSLNRSKIKFRTPTIESPGRVYLSDRSEIAQRCAIAFSEQPPVINAHRAKVLNTATYNRASGHLPSALAV